MEEIDRPTLREDERKKRKWIERKELNGRVEKKGRESQRDRNSIRERERG